MNCIGIRVLPKVVYFTVIEYQDNNVSILTVDKLVAPASLEMPDKLSYIRTTMFSVINEYNVSNAWMRRMEDNSQNINIDRAYIEGVIQELISNCTIEKYFSGKKSQIASYLNMTSKDVEDNFSGNSNKFSIDDWEQYKKEERESILCALTATQI
nr:hypothetical protein [uncultured Lachnoclostridium sp.]